MSENAKQKWGQQRAVWSLKQEQVLMELFGKARQDPKKRTGRGVRHHGWESIAEEMNLRCKTAFNVDQLKSKSSRIMMDYELFKDVGGERSLGDKDWDRLIKNMPQHAQRLRLFKESGFPHVDICRRISAGKEDPNALAGQKVEAEPQAPTAGSVKRSNSQEIEAPKAKRVCAPVEHESVQWSHDMERLLLFLCWRLKNIRGVLVDEGIKPQMWLEVAKELNEHVKTNFNKQQVKAKYLDLLLHYDRFKLATGYSGVADSFPKTDLEWEQLMRERPRYHGELQRLKDDGGFPHVNICSLITGDTPPNGMGPASVSDFLATGALQGAEHGHTHSSARAVAIAQASLSASKLSQSLPAATNPPNPPLSTAESGQTSSATPASEVSSADTAPAVFTQELHDNLNMFLKTATAYLVMLINDHNKESGP